MRIPLISRFITALIIFIAPVKTQAQQTLTQINGWNAYVHLPWDYNANPNKHYPTIVFFPGIGEVGTTASKVIANGPGAYIASGWNGNVKVGNDSVKFIIVSLQPPQSFPPEIYIDIRLETIKSLYRVDESRLHLTGLSHGGWCSDMYITGDNLGGPYTYASKIASVVEVQGVQPSDNAPYPNLFDNFVLSGGRFLGFEQLLDFRDTRTRVNRMNSTKPNSAIYVQTLFGLGGHCCWANFYGGGGTAPGTFLLDGTLQNLYQWIGRQSRPQANIPPVVTAGTDQILTLPTNATTLYGVATDPGGLGTIAWSKASGPSAGVITNPAAAQTPVTGLVEGIYDFALNVTDNVGASSKDTVRVTVRAPVPAAAVAIAGPVNACSLVPAAGNGNGTPGTYSTRKVNYASSYTWTVPTGATILSHPAGTGANDTIITVKFLNTFTSGNISVKATSSAGTGPATNLSITKTVPANPGAIRGATDICDLSGKKIVYSISPVAGATAYEWSVPAGAAVNGRGTDTLITVNFNPNFTSGSISVKATSNCGNSAGSSSITVSNKLPATPGAISGNINACPAIFGNSNGRYSIQAVALARSYTWSITGGATIVSGQGTTTIEIRFPATFTTAVLSVTADRTCGRSAAKTITITKSAPATPGTITASATPCLGRSSNVTYTIPEVPYASYYVWTMPANGTILSGQETRSIQVNYKTTFVSGDLKVRATSTCGTSANKVLAVVATKECSRSGGSIGIKSRTNGQGEEVNSATIVPNPNRGYYKLLIHSDNTIAPAKIEIRNMYGMLVYEMTAKNRNGVIDVMINNPNLARGIYNVTYIIDGKYQSLKMLVEK